MHMNRVFTGVVLPSILILLFAYTAISKLLSFDRFRAVLRKAPLMGLGADVVAWMVVLIEAAIVLLLLFPATRLKGLTASLLLLSVFTVYLVWMLLFAPQLPCSCGGVIGALSWKAHVGLNAGLLGMTGYGIRCCKQILRAGI